MDKPGHVAMLELWMRSYRPEALFDRSGVIDPAVRALAPSGPARMSANPAANGGTLLRELDLPDLRRHALAVTAPGCIDAEATRVQGAFLRDVMRLNTSNFRIFSPDETTSNRCYAVFDVTTRCSTADVWATDESISADGRVMEMLSEHQCQGWLEGYVLTGRHGFFSCYEAFVHIVDSMANQYIKWVAASLCTGWRAPVAALNYLLSSHVWRQDHNGSSHQDPGFIDNVLSKNSSAVRVYLPPDANTLLAVTDTCLRARDCINVVIAGKHPEPQWLSIDEAIAHCCAGIGIWTWASNAPSEEPDIVMGCAGDVPTLEALAAVQLLREHFPALRVRVVNVVDLIRLQSVEDHPHGLNDAQFDALFTADRPVIFAYHGYPALIHRLTYRRTNHDNFHVHGFCEKERPRRHSIWWR